MPLPISMTLGGHIQISKIPGGVCKYTSTFRGGHANLNNFKPYSVVFVDFSEQDLHCYSFMFLFDDQIAGLKIYYKIEENTKISSVEAKTTSSR